MLLICQSSRYKSEVCKRVPFLLSPSLCSTCLSVCLSICLSIYLSIYQSVCLFLLGFFSSLRSHFSFSSLLIPLIVLNSTTPSILFFAISFSFHVQFNIIRLRPVTAIRAAIHRLLSTKKTRNFISMAALLRFIRCTRTVHPLPSNRITFAWMKHFISCLSFRLSFVHRLHVHHMQTVKSTLHFPSI